MTRMQSGESATILKFPVGGRRGIAAIRKLPAHKDPFDFPDVCDAASGGAWYHDAAIREGDDSRKA